MSFPPNPVTSKGSYRSRKKVCLDNDASEVDILAPFGTFWDILRRFETMVTKYKSHLHIAAWQFGGKRMDAFVNGKD